MDPSGAAANDQMAGSPTAVFHATAGPGCKTPSEDSDRFVNRPFRKSLNPAISQAVLVAAAALAARAHKVSARRSFNPLYVLRVKS